MNIFKSFKKRRLFSIASILSLTFIFAIPIFTKAPKAQSFSYDGYAYVLINYIDIDGMVNYRGLKSDRAKLDEFTKSLGDVHEKDFVRWSDNEKIVFWINAYNALTLKVIIDNYPIKPSFFASFIYPINSIRQIPGVWDEIRFPVMGRMMTLEDIEHRRLRSDFNEPRIHFAIVCASRGCSPLRNMPYSADKLDSELDGQVDKFLGKKNKFRIDSSKKAIYLSPIFKWFAEDFIKKYGENKIFSKYGERDGAVINFISQHISRQKLLLLKNREYDVEYLDYDWSLNEQK